MNIKELHDPEKVVSAKPLFKMPNSSVMAIQILASNSLKDHQSKIPALLVCVSGIAQYVDIKDLDVTLKAGDYVEIEPNVIHRVDGITDCQLLLIR